MILKGIVLSVLAVWLLSGLFLYVTKVVKDTFVDCLWTPPVAVIVNSIPRSLWLMITIAVIAAWAAIMEFGLWLYVKIFCQRQNRLI